MAGGLAILVGALPAGAAGPGAYVIVDTGQERCYNQSAEIAYPAVTAPFCGQDAQFQGVPFNYRNNGDGTVSDLSTGLTWQRDPGAKQSCDQAVAGTQRSDPKAGNAADYPQGRGPQGDAIRILNFVRCVRGGPALGQAIRAAGFDPERLCALAPPPDGPLGGGHELPPP